MITYAITSQDDPKANTRLVSFGLYQEGNLRQKILIYPAMYFFPEQAFIDADLMYNQKQKNYYSVMLQTNYINFYSGVDASTDLRYDTSNDGLCPKKLTMDKLDSGSDDLVLFSVLSDCNNDTTTTPRKIVQFSVDKKINLTRQ